MHHVGARATLPVALVLVCSGVQAETDLSFYGGIAEAASPGSTDGSVAASDTFGLRLLRWTDDALGYGIDFSRTSLEPAATGTDSEPRRLDTLTATAAYRWPDSLGGVTPYVTGGLGVALPLVETAGSGDATYRIGGPAAALAGGIRYDVTDSASIFSEVRVTASRLSVDLEDGGTQSSDLLTNAVNLGVSFRF